MAVGGGGGGGWRRPGEVEEEEEEGGTGSALWVQSVSCHQSGTETRPLTTFLQAAMEERTD